MIEVLVYPEFQSLNGDLESWIDFLPNDTEEYSNLVVTKQTGYNTYPKPFLKLKDWVVNKISPDREMEYQLWGAIYNYGDYAKTHKHSGHDENASDYSFVYYVNAPDGSSPLLFSDIIINPSPGLCVIFSSDEVHRVPENKCERRIVLAGNLKWNGL